MVKRDTISPDGARRRFALDPRVRLAIIGVVGAVATALTLTLLGSMAGGASRALPAAKPFALPALGSPGGRVSLSAYDGKPVILNFFASWCSPCQQETPRIAQYYRSVRAKVTVIGIDVNDPSAAALKFVRADGVTYPVAADAQAAAASAYGVMGLPQTFFLNSQHRIVKRVAGAVTLQELQAGTAMIDPRTK